MHLALDRVGKRYGRDLWALRDFSVQLRTGVVGLLGPNGAGKSTLMRVLATVARPTEGRVTWNGRDVHKAPGSLRAVLGYLPQDFGVYPNLNAVEFLDYLAAVKGLGRRSARQRIDALLSLVNLSGVARRPLHSYSGGMRQRLGIAQALLNDPQLLIVDEPTVGLDPEERVRFRNLLSELAGERIIILSTHIVSDVEASATSIVLIDRGRLVVSSVPEQLIADAEGKVWEFTIPSDALPAVRRSHVISGAVRRGDGVQVRVVSEVPLVSSHLPTSDDPRPVVPTLEDAYLFRLKVAPGPGGALGES